MNANELANYLEKCISNDNDIYEQAAIMLRQQQAEIEALKKKIVSLEFLARKEK